MRLLVDAGNTRIKWALTTDGGWLANGAFPTASASELGSRLQDVAEVREVWCSNVAGALVERALRESVPSAEWNFIVAQERQCGVHNRYTEPARLGCDRWAALIAAWQEVRGACLVVGSGTATTVDALSDTGEFLGGLILPGIELMQRALYDAAAGLAPSAGGYAEFPRDTPDAIFSGALQATCGAIEQQYRLLGASDAAVVLGGGAAEILRERLTLPVRLMDNPVLRGIWLISQESKA